MERLGEVLTSSWFRRIVIGLYAAALAITIGAYIGISLLDVQTAVYFRGDASLEKGRGNAVRGVVLNAPTGQFRRDVEVRFALAPAGYEPREQEAGAPKPKLHGLGVARPGRGGIVQTELNVPGDLESGDYELLVTASGPNIERYQATSRVSVQPATSQETQWLSKTSRINDPKRREKLSSGPIQRQDGDLAVGVLPFDAEVPRGLPGVVHLVTYEAESGEPVASRVTFEKVEGIGKWGQGSDKEKTLETDALGLVEVPLDAVGGQKWTLSVEESHPAPQEGEEGESRSGTTTLHVHTVPSQISLKVANPILDRGSKVQGSVHGLFRAGALFVDTYRDREWIAAESTPIQKRKAAFRTTVPRAEETPWLHRIQVSRGFYDAGQAWDIAHVITLDDSSKSGLRRGLGRLGKFIAENRDDTPYFDYLAESDFLKEVSASKHELSRWLEVLLEGLPRHFSRPGTLFNSQKSDREALEVWKDEVQADLMILIVIALVGGLGVILYVVVVGIQRKREHDRELREIDVELAAEEAVDAEEESVYGEPGRADQFQAGLLGFIALATFIMFGLGLILLLSYL